MTATPFEGSLTLQYTDGSVQVETFQASDVAGQFVQFDNSGLAFLTVRGDCRIADISLLATGADTKRLALFVNNRDPGVTFLQAGLLTSVQTAHIPVPPGIKGGSQVQFKQA